MATGEWNPQKIEREIRDYCALEMPLPPESLSRNPQFRNDENQKKQILTLEKPYIIHGPEKASRITIRSQDMNESLKIIKNLKVIDK
jgi:hypothetical protein